MAFRKKYPSIVRTGGPFPSNRFGIILKYLSRLQRRFLAEHPILRERAKDDQFVQILLELTNYSVQPFKSKDRLYYDWSTGSIVEKEELINNYNSIPWVCAISGKPITCRTDDFSIENFVHSEYHDVLKAPMVDSRILKSSVEFRKYVKKLLMNEQQELLRLAKKNSKVN
jgi:hypothetical protein